MKLSKGQGMSLFAAFILFGIFNVVVFLAPLAHTVVFWLGYFFALFALATITLTLILYFGKPVQEEKFLSLPAVKVAWTYFVLQTALSVWEMVAFPLPYLPVLIINLVLGAVFAIIILALYAASGKIDKSEQFTAEKVIFIKQLKLKLDSIETDDINLEKKIKELAEDVRFSDQMSHSKLAEIESELDSAIDELADTASNTEEALVLCAKAAKLLKKRNDQCKMYKGIKDPVAAEAQKSGNGRNLAFAGVCVMLAMFLITISVYFVIVPQTKYNDAIALMEAEKYDEATAAFTDLGDYRDSEAKIEEIKIILLDKKYDAAVELMNAEKYDEATTAFTELGDHRDSKAKIDEIKTILLDQKYDAAIELLNAQKYDEATVAFAELGDHRDSKEKIAEIRITLLDNKYAEAEKLFYDGKYTEALEIYKELNNYKESVGRVEEIKNRLSTGKVIYFGTYNGEPIAWRIVKTEDNRLLLLADKPIKQLPIHSEIKDVEFKDSTLNAWLNNELIQAFSDKQKDQILTVDGVKIFLLSEKTVNELKNAKVDIKCDSDWWIAQESNTGFKYVDKNGKIVKAGDLAIRDKGVRPAIWISLE